MSVIRRDQVWVHAFKDLDKVLNGQREQPTIEAFLEELPNIEWPATSEQAA
jgi:hypothetical protein